MVAKSGYVETIIACNLQKICTFRCVDGLIIDSYCNHNCWLKFETAIFAAYSFISVSLKWLIMLCNGRIGDCPSGHNELFAISCA